ncbi:MAG: hypothetical protein IPJ07_03835 [Acidobacteria bacterium]|nr:hypothetical protein [Acidobacteriota bacterium]
MAVTGSRLTPTATTILNSIVSAYTSRWSSSIKTTSSSSLTKITGVEEIIEDTTKPGEKKPPVDDKNKPATTPAKPGETKKEDPKAKPVKPRP